MIVGRRAVAFACQEHSKATGSECRIAREEAGAGRWHPLPRPPQKRNPPGTLAEMGLLRRIFGPATDTTSPPVVEDGHAHARGWKRQASEAAGGV